MLLLLPWAQHQCAESGAIHLWSVMKTSPVLGMVAVAGASGEDVAKVWKELKGDVEEATFSVGQERAVGHDSPNRAGTGGAQRSRGTIGAAVGREIVDKRHRAGEEV